MQKFDSPWSRRPTADQEGRTQVKEKQEKRVSHNDFE